SSSTASRSRATAGTNRSTTSGPGAAGFFSHMVGPAWDHVATTEVSDTRMGVTLKQSAKVGAYVMGKRLSRQHKYPLVLMLEPLFRCNLACGGCGTIQHPEETLNKRLSPEACLAAAEECGAPMESIAAREPLIHPENDQIV